MGRYHLDIPSRGNNETEKQVGELIMDAALNLSLISALIELRAMTFIVIISGFLIAPLFMMERNGGTSANVGVVLIITGSILCGISMYGIDQLTQNRPHQIIPGTQFNHSDYQPISSLDDSQTYSMSGHGSFFLGIGSVSMNGVTTPQYVFYKILPDGYQLGTIAATDVIIREDANTTTSRVEWLYQHTVSDKTEYLDNNETIGGAESVSLIKTYIHVPNGTVKVQYNLDSNLGGK